MYYFVPNDKKPGQGPEVLDDFERIHISRAVVDRFFDLFVRLDRDRTGTVDLDEFYRYFGIERSPFADRVFSIMDEDASGQVTFREFGAFVKSDDEGVLCSNHLCTRRSRVAVICMWNYCSLDIHNLLRFSFDLFDTDLSGQLGKEELKELLTEVYGTGFDRNYRMREILEQIDRDRSDTITFEEFREFNSRFPSLLFPAFRMQQILRDRVFGEKFWEEQYDKMVAEAGRRKIPVWDLVEAVERARANAQASMQATIARRGAEERRTVSPGQEGAEPENVDIPQFTISEAAQRDARLAQKELLEKADEEWIALRQARREAKRQQRNARHELDRGRRRSVGEGMARTAHLQNEMGRITALQATGQLE